VLKSKIEELRKQLNRIESGNTQKAASKDNGSSEVPGYYIPFDQMPSLGLQLARLMRETKVQEEVFRLLTSQYEIAKLEEAKDVNTIQILDLAKPPDKKSSPKPILIVGVSAFMALPIGVFLAFLLEQMHRFRMREPERYSEIAAYLKFRRKEKNTLPTSS
jgi:hypothetical protein